TSRPYGADQTSNPSHYPFFCRRAASVLRAGTQFEYPLCTSHWETTMSQDAQAFNVGELFSIEGKVALVTGGSRGIGLMIARGFVEAGAKTYISSRKADVCDRVAKELSASGTCISLPADLGTEAGARQLADAIGARESALHILVNNAGANWGAPMEEYPDTAWDKVLALNVK